LRLVSAVSAVRSVAAGESVGYGGRFVADAGTTIATVPVGYGDGVPRSLGLVGGEVLIDGRRRPIAGVVSMDQLTVATNGEVAVGDEVVLLGSATSGSRRGLGGEAGTIGYEIVRAQRPAPVAWRARPVRVAARPS
jgi:alanine racemase